MRFGLALLVAGLLYFWRFHAKKVVFGANAFDYAEAFALGFAVSLAINSLPEKLAKWVLKCKAGTLWQDLNENPLARRTPPC